MVNKLPPLSGPVGTSGEPELQIAERIARAAHAGQKDTVTGADYITHVERVAALVDGDDAKAVAWLHDVLEDCDEWTYDDLIREGISQRVCDAVDALTRQPPYSYAEYIEQIRVDKNPLVVAVKLADLRDHLQLNCPTRLRPRYEAALKSLTAAASVPSPPAQERFGRPQPMTDDRLRKIAEETAHKIEKATQHPPFADICSNLIERFIYDAIAAGSALPPSPPVADTWLPIESAPKDGTQILVYDLGAMVVADWVDDGEEAGWWDVGFMEPPPTHWMPLPSAPSASAAAPRENTTP